MAFQQPVHAPSRPLPPVSETIDRAQGAPSTQCVTSADAQEWVLFPAPRHRSSSLNRTASTACTPQTAGLSRLSELGSFDTAACSGTNTGDDVVLGDDEDLDSLDDGLHAFEDHPPGQESTVPDYTGSILPTHDGLGTFPGSSALLREHLWRFEQSNPQRRPLGHSRRRSSVQRILDAMEQDDGLRMEKERTDRIERWRLEHSRILLEEVEKASRRSSNHQPDLPPVNKTDAAEAINSHTSHAVPSVTKEAIFTTNRDGEDLQDEHVSWYRLVEEVMRKFLGLDENVLSFIFGESLPTEARRAFGSSAAIKGPSNRKSITQASPILHVAVLNRLSQDLASILRHILYTTMIVDYPLNRMTLDYAGIPIAGPGKQRPSPSPLPQSASIDVGMESAPTPVFKPTLDERPPSATSDFGHAALWGIEEEAVDGASATQDREYWEQTPSIRNIFRLLHQHFTTRRRPLLANTTFSSSGNTSKVATQSTAESLRRAHVIRQHHPLVARQHRRRNTAFPRHYSSHSIPNPRSPLFRRGDGSCASASSRKSNRGSGSSRHYWDIGGSIGSGSVGGIGVWGEV